MLARDFVAPRDASIEFESKAKPVVDKYHQARESWIDFCLFPDIVEPQRMPSLFPIPTHLCRRQTIQTIQVPASGNIYGMFKPITVDPVALTEGYRAAFSYNFTSAGTTNSDDITLPAVLKQDTVTNTMYAPAPATVGGLIHGGARLIAAFIEIDYIGTLDQHSGLIECGLHMHSVNSFNDMNVVHLYDNSEVVQAPFYKRFKPLDGVRCVWFPVDDNDFQFQDYDIGGLAGIGEAATAASVTLRQPVLPQWAINLTGLQNNQTLRVHICAYYETIVDEGLRDVFMVTRGKSTATIPQVKAAVSAAIQNGLASTPSKTSSGWGGLYEQMRYFMNTAKEAFGLASDFAPVLGTIVGGPVGASIGSGIKAASNMFGLSQN